MGDEFFLLAPRALAMEKAVGRNGERAKWLRCQAEAEWSEAESLREQAADCEGRWRNLHDQALEAERDTPEDDARWAELCAARWDRRQDGLNL